MLRIFVAFLASVSLTVADISQCTLNEGDPLQWLEIEITDANILESSHGGFPQGPNFCYGPQEGEPDDFQIKMYTLFHCVEPDTGPREAKKQEKVLPECGDLDEGARFCTDNNLRLLARVFGSFSTTAREYAALLYQAIQPRDHAVFVAKFTGDGIIATRFFTDRNLCVLTVDSGNPDYDWIVVTARLANPLIEPFQGPNKGVSPAMANYRQSIQTQKAARQGDQEPPIGEECRFEVETFAGYWSNIHIPFGASQAVVVGDGRVGDNSCLDFVRSQDTFQLSYFARTDMICDNPAPTKTCAKNGKSLNRLKWVNVVSSSDKKELQRLPAECIFDTRAEFCIDFNLRENIHRAIDDYNGLDPYPLSKSIQAMLPNEGTGYSVMVARMTPDSLYAIVGQSDPNLCFVSETTETGPEPVEFVVLASKLDFNPPKIPQCN